MCHVSHIYLVHQINNLTQNAPAQPLDKIFPNLECHSELGRRPGEEPASLRGRSGKYAGQGRNPHLVPSNARLPDAEH